MLTHWRYHSLAPSHLSHPIPRWCPRFALPRGRRRVAGVAARGPTVPLVCLRKAVPLTVPAPGLRFLKHRGVMRTHQIATSITLFHTFLCNNICKILIINLIIHICLGVPEIRPTAENVPNIAFRWYYSPEQLGPLSFDCKNNCRSPLSYVWSREQNGPPFADDIFKCIFLNENPFF